MRRYNGYDEVSDEVMRDYRREIPLLLELSMK
jgi:hypothetical protein